MLYGLYQKLIKNLKPFNYSELKKINSNATIVLTVSPVRHIRDGVHQNNVSKSSLILACEAIENTFNDVHFVLKV